MNSKGKSGMIDRAIENWLINTNEKNYLTAFCTVLINKGHKIKNIHGPLEDGKDIISIGPDNEYYAFQLKKGDLNSTGWREIKPQIDELIEIPIKHPSFIPEKQHKSYLVTNGVINSFAINKINSYNDNQASRGYKKLITIDKNDLLKCFKETQGKLIPEEFDDYYLFLDLLTSNGADFLPKEKFIKYLEKVVFKKTSKNKAHKLNVILSSLIIVSYLLEPFDKVKNYYAIFEAWTSLAALIIRYGARYKINKEDYEKTFELILNEIERNLLLFKKEIFDKNDFLEGSLVGENKIIYNSRILITLGTLSSLEIYLLKTQKDYKVDEHLFKLIIQNKENLFIWGEGAFPFIFNIIKYLEIVSGGNISYFYPYHFDLKTFLEYKQTTDIANSLLNKIFINLINRNQRRQSFALINPYYTIKDCVEAIIRVELGLSSIITIIHEILAIDATKTLEEIYPQLFMVGKTPNLVDKNLIEILNRSNLTEIDFDEFSGASFILETLILMLTRRKKKNLLKKYWLKISDIFFSSFRFDIDEDIFAWRTPDGSTHEEPPLTPQSWKELVRKSLITNSNETIQENILFLNFFIIVFPHRSDKSIINILDKK